MTSSNKGRAGTNALHPDRQHSGIERAFTKTRPPRYVSLPGFKIAQTKFCSLCHREYIGDQVAHLKTECGK